MSLMGVKINIYDDSTALFIPIEVMLYKSDLPLSQLPLERLKSFILEIVVNVDIWWAGKPYLKIIIDNEREDLFMQQYRAKRVGTSSDRRRKPLILLDILDATGEPLTRLLKAKDLYCLCSRTKFTENLFMEGEIYINHH